MHDLHVLLGLGEHTAFQNIHVLYALVFHQVAEAFLLDACHIEDVGSCYHVFVEVFVLHIFDSMMVAVEFVLLWHGQLLWCDEVEGRVEVAHGSDERVYCSAIFQVAHEIDIQILECSLCLVDGVEVEQAL